MQIDLMQHSDNLGYSQIAAWADQAGVDLREYRPDLGDDIATINPAKVDGLIVLGGPQSVNDEESWLAAERIIIRSLGKMQRPVFGIGLGAQQIVRAFGAAVLPLTTPTHGLVQLHDSQGGDDFTAVTWNDETISELPGAQTLFAAADGRPAGFAYHDNIVGLQFHPELTGADLQTFYAAQRQPAPQFNSAAATRKLNSILSKLFS